MYDMRKTYLGICSHQNICLKKSQATVKQVYVMSIYPKWTSHTPNSAELFQKAEVHVSYIGLVHKILDVS